MMTDANERLQILQMIQNGQINAEEGIRRLEEFGTDAGAVEPPASASGPRFLHVLVTDTRSNKASVNVRIPVNLINAGVKMGAHLHTEVNGANMDQVRELIRENYIGTVLDATDDEEDERVQLFLE
jgi:hypothetical protein